MAVLGFVATETKRILKLREGKVRENWQGCRGGPMGIALSHSLNRQGQGGPQANSGSWEGR